MRVALLMLNWFIPYPSHFLETCSVVMFHYFLQKKSMSDRDSQAESSYDTDSNHSVGRESDAGSESLRDFIAEGDDHSVASEEAVDFDRLTKEQRQEYERRMHERAAREEDEFIHESSKNIVEGKRRNRGKKRTTADEVEDLETQLDELKRDSASFIGIFVRELAHQGGTYDDAIGESANSGRVMVCAYTETNRSWEPGLFTDDSHAFFEVWMICQTAAGHSCDGDTIGKSRSVASDGIDTIEICRGREQRDEVETARDQV